MTYIIDLQQLWEPVVGDSASSTLSDKQLESRKNVVSVVVIAQFNEKLMKQALNSVLAQQFVREIIIVNCEENDSLEKMLSQFTSTHPRCYLVRGHKQAGLAAAYNLGAQHASGQFLLFMKGNCLLSKNGIAKLLATGIRKPAPWVVGTAEKNNALRFKPFGKIKKLFSNTLDSLHYQGQEHEVSLAGGGFHAAHIGPECLFMATSSFMELKGLDKKCFHSTFHVDLCLRIHFAGGGVYSAREFEVVAVPGTLPSLVEDLRQEWQAFSGRTHFYKKYVRRTTNDVKMFFLYGALMIGFIARAFFKLLGRLIPKSAKKPKIKK